MADTFGGVTFQMLIAGHSEGGDSKVTVEQFGATVVVDLGGPEPVWLDCDIKFASETAFGNLLALRGTSNTLVYRGGVSRTAVLKSLYRNAWLPGGNRIGRSRWLLL